LIFLFLLLFLKLTAVPVGNPGLPALLEEGFVIQDTAWSNPQCGFSFDYLFQKRMRSCHSSDFLGLNKGFISGTSEVALITWNIRERFNFQIEFGTGQFSYGWQQKNLHILGNIRRGLLWGGDAKLIILSVRDTTFGLDAQAGGWDWMDGFSTYNGLAGSNHVKSILRFWQLGAALTQKIAFFAPYLGFAINRTRFKVSGLSTGTGRMHARHTLGLFGGCSISNGDRFLMGVEWRGWFEQGISLSAQLRF
jgi:hypothetical protein